ncbi:16S rRNA (cytosine(1402)-N(4))-methyltransferase [Aerococcus viridans]|uniref:16S rRNA (Cytosine(1402)-N(4))-methyltransferase n=1 Tax=Aerococcus viridans TaxID=1377 RepID=A0A2N6UCM5_9LACT|nr:class I SAM-dependent methyltransferase [Aerococcus viridans]PMC79344.1 16S rRNA (cytosine(1402)-N(4))-methyltransferase [Aerococcus viridans]
MFQNTVTITHQIMKEKIQKGDHVLDATVGKGNDTLLLSQLVEEDGIVYGLDIQPQAIALAEKRLCNESNYKNTKLFVKDHSELKQILPEEEKLQLAIFNLGYLPSGDKQIITQANTTIKAITSVLEHLDTMGLLLVASYIGHLGGMAEFEAVQSYLEKLDQKSYNVAMFNFLNQKNLPPRLFIVERRK